MSPGVTLVKLGLAAVAFKYQDVRCTISTGFVAQLSTRELDTSAVLVVLYRCSTVQPSCTVTVQYSTVLLCHVIGVEMMSACHLSGPLVVCHVGTIYGEAHRNSHNRYQYSIVMRTAAK